MTLSHSGYVKSPAAGRLSRAAARRAQKTGGAVKDDDDFVDHLFIANTHDTFSASSRTAAASVGSRSMKCRRDANRPRQTHRQHVPARRWREDQRHPVDQGVFRRPFIFVCTAQGTVKKTPLSDFSNPRKAGIIAVALDEGDYLIGAEITSGTRTSSSFPTLAKAVWFDEEDVRRWAGRRAACAA